MRKGQMGDMTSIGYGLLMLGIVFAVGLVVLAQFQTSVAPDLTKTVTDATGLANDTSDDQIWYTEDVDMSVADFGRWLSGTLSVNFTGEENTTKNVTLELNDVAVGQANGYNASGEYEIALTASQLVEDTNTLAALHNVTMNVSSYILTGIYEERTKTDSADIAGDVIGVFDDAIDWLPIIVIVLVVAIVLGLLGLGFGRR